MQDLYGNAVAGALISALSRLLTFYLQIHGFTCGFDDLLLVPAAEQQRRAMLEAAETAAVASSARFVGQDVSQLLQGGQDSGDPLRQSLIPVRSQILWLCLSALFWQFQLVSVQAKAALPSLVAGHQMAVLAWMLASAASATRIQAPCAGC